MGGWATMMGLEWGGDARGRRPSAQSDATPSSDVGRRAFQAALGQQFPQLARRAIVHPLLAGFVVPTLDAVALPPGGHDLTGTQRDTIRALRGAVLRAGTALTAGGASLAGGAVRFGLQQAAGSGKTIAVLAVMADALGPVLIVGSASQQSAWRRELEGPGCTGFVVHTEANTIAIFNAAAQRVRLARPQADARAAQSARPGPTPGVIVGAATSHSESRTGPAGQGHVLFLSPAAMRTLSDFALGSLRFALVAVDEWHDTGALGGATAFNLKSQSMQAAVFLGLSGSMFRNKPAHDFEAIVGRRLAPRAAAAAAAAATADDVDEADEITHASLQQRHAVPAEADMDALIEDMRHDAHIGPRPADPYGSTLVDVMADQPFMIVASDSAERGDQASTMAGLNPLTVLKLTGVAMRDGLLARHVAAGVRPLPRPAVVFTSVVASARVHLVPALLVVDGGGALCHVQSVADLVRCSVEHGHSFASDVVAAPDSVLARFRDQVAAAFAAQGGPAPTSPRPAPALVVLDGKTDRALLELVYGRLRSSAHGCPIRPDSPSPQSSPRHPPTACAAAFPQEAFGGFLTHSLIFSAVRQWRGPVLGPRGLVQPMRARSRLFALHECRLQRHAGLLHVGHGAADVRPLPPPLPGRRRAAGPPVCLAHVRPPGPRARQRRRHVLGRLLGHALDAQQA